MPKSWYDLSSISHPPLACFGVPTISPFSACQSAWPTACQPFRLDP